MDTTCVDEILLPTKVYAPDGREQKFSMMTEQQRLDFAQSYLDRQAFVARHAKPTSVLSGIWTF